MNIETQPNQTHSLDGAERTCLHFGHEWRAASDARRYANDIR